MPTYRLATDGDAIEQLAYSTFLPGQFPAYEVFWDSFITPLTGRPNNIHFLDDAGLNAISRSHEDLCIAQLHYSIISHLNRAYQITQINPLDFQLTLEAFTRLVGASDNAFELLERFTNSGQYDAWVENGARGGKKARSEWQKKTNFPLQDIRNYRNSLLHGRLFPSFVVANSTKFPKISLQHNYLDWRSVTDPARLAALPQADFEDANSITSNAFTEVIKYLETNWRKHLLAGSQTIFPAVISSIPLSAPASGSVIAITVSGTNN